IKVLDIDTTRNALVLAHQAFAVGSSTLQTLQEHGDRLQNAEDNFRGATSANDHAAQKLEELKKRDDVRAVKWHVWKETHIHAFASVPLCRGATELDVLARAKYQFEEDSDDEELENVIDGNIEEL
ncbi:hypothetical protein CC86DRAFT_257409, partial [Ophiobolus disseminans]